MDTNRCLSAISVGDSAIVLKSVMEEFVARSSGFSLRLMRISAGECDTSSSTSSKCITHMATSSDILVSDRLKTSPNRMDTSQTTPQSTSSGDQRMDVDSPPPRAAYRNLYADDILATRPTSAMSVYTPTQTHTLPLSFHGLPGDNFSRPFLLPFKPLQKQNRSLKSSFLKSRSPSPSDKRMLFSDRLVRPSTEHYTNGTLPSPTSTRTRTPKPKPSS